MNKQYLKEKRKKPKIARMELEKLVYILSPLNQKEKPNLAQVLMLTPLQQLASTMGWQLILDDLNKTIGRASPEVMAQARSLLT